MRELDSILTALAARPRRQVVDLLRERPHRAGELAAAIDMTAPAMSKHLRILRTSGLIEEQRLEEDARVRVFRLRHEPFEELQAWLREVGSYWEDQLGSFKAHAERSRKKRARSKGRKR